jgi:rod shape-determining protein MreD
MTWVIMALVVLVATVVQGQVPGLAVFGEMKPPILLGVVLYYAVKRGRSEAYVCALAAGFMQDASGYIPLGYSSLAFCLVVWLLARFTKVALQDSPIAPFLFGSVAAPFCTLLLFLLLKKDSLIVGSTGGALVKMFGATVLALVATPLAFLLAGVLDRMVGNVEIRERLDEIE